MFFNKNYFVFNMFVFLNFLCVTKKNLNDNNSQINMCTPPHILFKTMVKELEDILKEYYSEERLYKNGKAIMEDTINFENAMKKLVILSEKILELEKYRRKFEIVQK